MSIPRREGLAVGERLPSLTLEAVAGEAVNLHRARHDSSVLVLLHPHCDECHAYLHLLEETGQDLRIWGGRPVAVLTDPDEARSLAPEFSFPVLLDPDARARHGMHITHEDAGVVVADRFGTVYLSAASGRDHGFPTREELISEARYIGTQCPECGVPDEPLRGQVSWAP